MVMEMMACHLEMVTGTMALLSLAQVPVWVVASLAPAQALAWVPIRHLAMVMGMLACHLEMVMGTMALLSPVWVPLWSGEPLLLSLVFSCSM